MIRTCIRALTVIVFALFAQTTFAYPPTGVITLDQLLSQIEKSSPRLAQAKAELAEVKSKYSGARAISNPEMSFSEERLEYPAGDETERTVSVTQDISFLWNSPQNVRSWSASYQAALARFQEKKIGLLCDVMIELLRRDELHQQLELAKDISSELTELTNQTNARVELGDIPAFDGARFNQALLQFAGMRAALRAEQSEVIQELMALTGLDAGTVGKMSVSESKLILPFSNVNDALEYSESHSFALKSAQFEATAANQSVSARKWAMLPDVSLGFGRKVVSGGFDGPVAHAQIEIPLLNQGRSELTIAVAQRNLADAKLAVNKKSINESIKQTWALLEQVEADLNFFSAASGLDNASQAIRLYNFGETSALETVDLLQSIVESEHTLAELRIKQQILIKGILIKCGFPVFEDR